MKIFKITNITNQAGKRDLKFNATLNIEYIVEMKKLSTKLEPGKTIYLKTNSLELSIQKLKVSGLITVSEIGEDELKEITDKNKPKIVEKIKPIEIKKEPIKKTQFGNKKKSAGDENE